MKNKIVASLLPSLTAPVFLIGVLSPQFLPSLTAPVILIGVLCPQFLPSLTACRP